MGGGCPLPNPWFRMYGEFADDAKVQMMPEALQRRLLMLFCLQCQEQLEGSTDSSIAFRLRICDDDVTVTKRHFMSQGFIDENWNLLNWQKRQFVSDSSADRTRRYRERKRTSQQRHGDGIEQNRTEQIHKQQRFALPEWIPSETWKDFEESRNKLRKPMTDRARKDIIAKLDQFRQKGQSPEAVIAQSIRKGWQDVFELKEDLFAKPKHDPLAGMKFANGVRQ
jgi:hypothetical protein